MKADGLLRTAVGAIALVAIVAATGVAGAVLAPIVYAAFIIAVVWPLQRRLQSFMPQLLALAIVVVVVTVSFVSFASLVVWAFSRVGRWLVSDAARYQLRYDELTTWLEGHGIAVAALWAEHFDVRWLVRVVQLVTERLNATVSFWLVVLVYVILGLLEVKDVARKVQGLENREAARVLCDGSAACAARFRTFALVRTLMSLVTGVLVWGLATFSGLQFAAEWGVIAFAMNYIPFIGPFIATLFPTLFALAQFASWEGALAMFAGLNVIQFVTGSYIEPRISGSALDVSPFVVLFSVFFWAFLWGVFGAFIGVPITIAVLTFCAQHPSSRWVSDLFGKHGARQAVAEAR
jgi:predicted PurR-regulated permease PerM